MSERKLPEELLHRILSLHFARIPEAFCGDSQEDNTFGSVPMTPMYPISNALLVSKRWLRIGTPLLYQSLSLGKIEHVEAVVEVFRANPGLGKAVRHVRLHGGYKRELKDVLGQTPNVKHVSVWLEVMAKDSVVGLVRSIPLLDPTALYLRVPRGRGARRNKKQLEILHSLESAMAESWPSLKFLYFWRFSELPATLCAAICRSPTLKEISIHGLGADEWLWRGWLKTVSKNKNIARVLYRGETRFQEAMALAGTVVPSDALKLLTQAENTPVEAWADQPMHVPGVYYSLPASWVEQLHTNS